MMISLMTAAAHELVPVVLCLYCPSLVLADDVGVLHSGLVEEALMDVRNADSVAELEYVIDYSDCD